MSATAAGASELRFDTSFDPQTGTPVPVAEGIGRVTAANRGPYTFTGTNSFLLGGESVLVVDPGPNEPAHLQALLRAIDGRPVEAILLTHTHRDHSDLARTLATATRAPLWFGGRHRLSREPRRFEINPLQNECDWDLVPDRVLRDGERFGVGEMRIDVFATPGHCANHLCFGIAGTPYVLTGDHVMGWNSTLVAAPDGSMTDYLASLERLLAAAAYRHYLPAHGGPVAAGPAYARALLLHRQLRNGQVLEQVRQGRGTIGGLLEAIYPELSPVLRLAARMTLEAHVEYLEGRGQIIANRSVFGTRLRLPA